MLFVPDTTTSRNACASVELFQKKASDLRELFDAAVKAVKHGR